MAKFDTEAVLKIINKHVLSLNLRAALELAEELTSLHGERVCEVEDASYRQGYDVAKHLVDRTVKQDAYNEGHDAGYAKGKIAGANDRALIAEEAKKRLELDKTAEDAMPALFERYGFPMNKIAMIKEIRSITGWGLKQSKDYVEAWIFNNG